MHALRGRLILIPADLGSEEINHIFPPDNLTIIGHIRHFIVENERSARRFLRKAGFQVPFQEVRFYLLNKHTSAPEMSVFLNAADEGLDVGLLSEAGLPCIADPGQQIVAMAHRKQIRILPLTGPSSIMLALMASGFNGQQFVFHGYLPIEKAARIKKISSVERDAHQRKQTQIFMETPFRNNSILDDILSVCADSTLLCVACDLTLPTEYIRTYSISIWKKNKPDLHKRPGIFLIYHA